MRITTFAPPRMVDRPTLSAVSKQEEEDPDGEALKRAFLWGGTGLAVGTLSSVATTAAYALGGPVTGEVVRWGLTLAGGIAGAVFIGERMSGQEGSKRVKGFLAGAGAVGLCTTFGSMAGLEGGFLNGLMAAQASGGFGLLYGGYGALLLSGNEEKKTTA